MSAITSDGLHSDKIAAVDVSTSYANETPVWTTLDYKLAVNNDCDEHQMGNATADGYGSWFCLALH